MTLVLWRSSHGRLPGSRQAFYAMSLLANVRVANLIASISPYAGILSWLTVKWSIRIYPDVRRPGSFIGCCRSVCSLPLFHCRSKAVDVSVMKAVSFSSSARQLSRFREADLTDGIAVAGCHQASASSGVLLLTLPRQSPNTNGGLPRNIFVPTAVGRDHDALCCMGLVRALTIEL